MQITTPFYRKGGALGLIFKVRVFGTWPIGVGRLPREGGMGRWSSRPPSTLSFLPLSYRLAFSVRFFFLRPIPNNRACSHPTSSNNTGAKKEENMSCTRLIELHSSLIYTGIMKIILICRTRQLCFITRYAFTRNTVCNWDF